MHNLVSFNQLAYWNQTEKDLEENPDSLINSYFECLTECDDKTQTCKRICRELLET